MQIEQLSDIKALVMRLKSDTVPGSKTQSWLRLCPETSVKSMTMNYVILSIISFFEIILT